jgi:hypothetical protein
MLSFEFMFLETNENRWKNESLNFLGQIIILEFDKDQRK